MDKNLEPQFITIEIVGKEKRAANGAPFISVKDTNGVWHSVWDSNLFSFFEKGKKIQVLIEKNGNFSNIVDVVSDELGIQQKKTDYTDYEIGKSRYEMAMADRRMRGNLSEFEMLKEIWEKINVIYEAVQKKK